MITVKATREGLLGGKTSSGYLIDALVPFVALPSAAALRQRIILRNPRNDRTCYAIVLDVGPWNVNDNAYVFQFATSPGADKLELLAKSTAGVPPLSNVRPQSESGHDVSHNGKTNGAGIDLGELVWHALEMTDNDLVSWEFA